MELLLAEEEQKAAKKATAKKSASVKKKQAQALPQRSSPDTSSQDSACTAVNPAHLQAAAAADSALSTRMTAPVLSSQERFGEAAYAKMAAEIASRPTPPTLPGFYGMPEKDLCHAFDQDYAKQCEQLLAEEAAQAAAQSAAESPASSSPADHPGDSAGQLTGLMTTRAAVYGPVSLVDGTHKKLASLLQTKKGQAAAARLSPLESELPVCVFYPDDFMMRCSSEAAALLQRAEGTFRQDQKEGEGPVAADPTAALVNFQALLHQFLRCPLSEVRLLHHMHSLSPIKGFYSACAPALLHTPHPPHLPHFIALSQRAHGPRCVKGLHALPHLQGNSSMLWGA